MKNLDTKQEKIKVATRQTQATRTALIKNFLTLVIIVSLVALILVTRSVLGI